MTKRYEVFVSSSNKDLEQERAFLRDLIISNGNIPVGMEEFEASGRPSWNKIYNAIINCDYYILVIGGRYGAIREDGELSYTEEEYLLARRLNKEIIVFIMTGQALRNLPAEKRDRGTDRAAKAQKLERFRAAVKKFFVVEFGDFNDFKDKCLSKIPVWMQQHQPENGGWVRATELNKEICYKNVLSYLFDRINPYEDLSLTREYLENLRGNLSTIGEVADAMEAIIKLYVSRVIAAQIRVYFAYSLTSLNRNGQDSGEPAYRLGISNSKEGPWNQGCVYRGPSNIHNVYRRCDVLGISDTSRPSNDSKDMNQPVAGEGSVVAAPVIYGSKTKYSIGVVGLNSPHPTDALHYKHLIRELGILFSSLFYAHGQRAYRGRDNRQEEAVAYKLRSQILEHFGNDS